MKKMKIKITGILGILAFMMIFLYGCGGSSGNDCNNFIWTQEISDEAVALSEASAAFGQDPTLEKCEVYKSSLRNYIDALEGVNQSCFTLGANEQEYRQAITEARNEVDGIDCSEEVGNQ